MNWTARGFAGTLYGMALVQLSTILALVGSARAEEPEGPWLDGSVELVEFRLCLEASQGGDHGVAAECFLTFVQDHRDSEYRDEALYNAANQRDIGGQNLLANELYEQFVNEYPKDTQSAGLYFRIAANNEQLLELGEAVEAYTRLIHDFPDSPVAIDAQYNLSLLKAHLGDHEGAAAGFQAYAATWPDAPDAIDILWRAGDQLELVSAREAVSFYQSFRAAHGYRNVDRLLLCDDKLADLSDQLGDPKQGDAYRALLLNDWAQVEAAGRTAEVGRDGRHAAADASFRQVQARFDAVTAATPLSGSLERDERTLKHREEETLAFRTWSVVDVPRYKDFDDSAAIFYLNAKALLSYEQLGRQVYRCPPAFRHDDCVAYTEIVEEQVTPQFDEYRAQAVRELADLVALARKQKRWSTWVDRTEAELHDLDPERFPSAREEVVGATDASMPFLLK